MCAVYKLHLFVSEFVSRLRKIDTNIHAFQQHRQRNVNKNKRHVTFAGYDSHYLCLRLGMRGINNWPTIIYRLKNTGIPRYFMTSSIVDNFRKNPRVQIICSALTDFSLPHLLNSTQRGSMDAGVKTPQCPHLSSHYFISIL